MNMNEKHHRHGNPLNSKHRTVEIQDIGQLGLDHAR